LICDAGGGTVDLAVFEIEGDGSDRTLKEITTARGENCGSTFLDVKMRALLKARIGKYMSISPITLEEMTRSFIENHKVKISKNTYFNYLIFFSKIMAKTMNLMVFILKYQQLSLELVVTY
jgi:molecular chaperone DnaK (HSP70)